MAFNYEHQRIRELVDRVCRDTQMAVHGKVDEGIVNEMVQKHAPPPPEHGSFVLQPEYGGQ